MSRATTEDDALVIAVDFDGTLAEHEFPEIGREVPLALPWCRRFVEEGALLFLWTMRDDTSGERALLTEAVQWCHARGLYFWGENLNPQQQETQWSHSWKQHAGVFIDDAAAGVPLVYPPGRRPYLDWGGRWPHVVLEQIRQRRGRG